MSLFEFISSAPPSSVFHALTSILSKNFSPKKKSETANDITVPFLKWPGGKRWFISNHSDLLPANFKTYIEPFLGSGSIFFHLKPRRALLGDINDDLIACYLGIKNNWQALQKLLEVHQKKHSATYYYMVRNEEPSQLIQKAARLIYLNRTCFNGIYRVNREGKFNVPKGDRDSVLHDTDDFKAISQFLARAEVNVCDFEILINKAKRNDFIFADPPYTVRHNVNGFIKYNEKIFSWKDQIRLAKALIRARKRGVKIISTNANHASIKTLYKNQGFSLKTVSRFSPISANSGNRKQFEELVIVAD